MLDIVICEDNYHLLDHMTKLIEKISRKNNLEMKIAFKANNPEMVEAYMKDKREGKNVFFLDIDLKSTETGYSLAKKIRDSYYDSYIIFVSAHLEYLLQAFKVQAFDFLPKPVHPDALEQTLLNVCKDYHRYREIPIGSNRCIEVKNGPSMIKINLKDIVYVEKELNKTIFHLVSNAISCKLTLEYLENHLSNEGFIRCHRAFIVNKAYIKEINNKDNVITLENGLKCFIGRKYKQILTRDLCHKAL